MGIKNQGSNPAQSQLSPGSPDPWAPLTGDLSVRKPNSNGTNCTRGIWMQSKSLPIQIQSEASV